MIVRNLQKYVIPAKAGLNEFVLSECLSLWIPAFAGMTNVVNSMTMKKA